LKDNNKHIKSILFLSANDFKDKSIQVIRKTPEAYVAAGYKVFYIVARDNSKAGNYFYEEEINPEGVDVIRFSMPLNGLRNAFRKTAFLTVITQIAAYLSIFKLSRKAKKVLKNKKIDVLYGYETHGVCAVKLLRFFGRTKGIKIVSRFQGSWIAKYLKEKRRLKLLLNFDDVKALKAKADLCIMTNDGTEGDYALKTLKSKALKNMKFWVNGVDEMKLEETEYQDLKNKYNPNNDTFIICSISRLESWKRVDRIIHSIAKLVREHKQENVLYLLIGEGSLMESYKTLVKKLGIDKHVVFIGGIANVEIKKYLNLADVFISTYDLSNVGNPLLEAIRANKIIFTLNNGTTADWIQNNKNGFIYDVNKNVSGNIATDLNTVITDKTLQNEIIEAIKKTEKNKLWTWEQRFQAELDAVSELLQDEN
jgi:glycosyltransferase involved in cell wall biosynthesis